MNRIAESQEWALQGARFFLAEAESSERGDRLFPYLQVPMGRSATLLVGYVNASLQYLQAPSAGITVDALCQILDVPHHSERNSSPSTGVMVGNLLESSGSDYDVFWASSSRKVLWQWWKRWPESAKLFAELLGCHSKQECLSSRDPEIAIASGDQALTSVVETWEQEDDARFDLLVEKDALGQLNEAEAKELDQLSQKQDRTVVRVSEEDLKRERLRSQALAELESLLEKYAPLFSIKR